MGLTFESGHPFTEMSANEYELVMFCPVHGNPPKGTKWAPRDEGPCQVFREATRFSPGLTDARDRAVAVEKLWTKLCRSIAHARAYGEYPLGPPVEGWYRQGNVLKEITDPAKLYNQTARTHGTDI